MIRFQQITDDMLNTLNREKEGFCQGNYFTLQDAKKQLYALLTEIIMDESGYIIHEAIKLEEIKGQVDNYKSIAGT